MNFCIKHLTIFVIRMVSAFFRCLGWRACRFEPNCSRYAEEALCHFGILQGTRLALARLFRCHPFHEGGYDPLLNVSLRAKRSNLTG